MNIELIILPIESEDSREVGATSLNTSTSVTI